jgi:transcriptional regulator with XRE-family HTH domain
VKDTETAEQRAGALVRERRGSLGLSQGALAAAMRRLGYEGWQQSTIAKIEAASRPLRVNEVTDLAAVLGVDVAELLGYPGDLQFSRIGTLQRFIFYSDTAERLRAQFEALKQEAEQVVERLDHFRRLAETTRKSLIEMGGLEMQVDGKPTFVFPDETTDDQWEAARPSDVLPEETTDGHH